MNEQKKVVETTIEELKTMFIDVIRDQIMLNDRGSIVPEQKECTINCHKILERIANRYYTRAVLEKMFDISLYNFDLRTAGIHHKKINARTVYKLIDVIKYLDSQNIYI